jgi:hypothetical protein
LWCLARSKGAVYVIMRHTLYGGGRKSHGVKNKNMHYKIMPKLLKLANAHFACHVAKRSPNYIHQRPLA